MLATGRRLARLLCVLLLAAPLAAAGAGKSVLLLQQDDDAWPAYQAFYGGFQGVLAREFGADLLIYRENLDLTRFPDAAYRDALRRWYVAKYQAVPLDAIVALGPASLNFAISARRDHWQSVPIIFAGGDESTAARAADAGNATGLSLRVESAGTVELARALFPRASHLALVGDRELHETYFQGFEARLVELSRDLTVIDLRGLPMAKVLERVAALPADAIVHFSIFSVDGDGQRFIPRDALARIAAQSRAPVFGDLDSYLGTGAVGGRMTDIRAFGAAVATRVAPILRGSDAGAMESGASSWSSPVVDWRALRRWGVDEGRLPPGTEVRFRPPSLWEEHRGAVLGAAATFAVLLLLIGRLLHERRQRLVAEAEARARMTELGRANRISAAGELAAAIAHDLGQPLAAIRSNVESIELLLEADPPRIVEARAALADVRRDDQRAADVIERLRSLFRKSGPRQDAVRIDRLFEDVIGMASGAARKRRVVIESELDAPPIAVRADAIQLQQVFINLLLNALEAIPEGAARRKVVMSARRIAGGGIRLGIADSGTGVPEGARARILEPFYTTKADGTGVGLSIVLRIVESHGARLEVSGSGLGGADFSFVLPEERAAA